MYLDILCTCIGRKREKMRERKEEIQREEGRSGRGNRHAGT